MSYISTNPLFRSLDDAECVEFREYALFERPNPSSGDWHVMHPVCRRTWIERGVRLCPEGCAQCAADLDEAHFQ